AASVALALPPAHRLVVLVFLACPCSTASYIMDKAMGGDAELSGAAVVLSTALCALPAALAVAAAGCA
ncbi:MAG: AEC family transporter, partial [Kiritimatiellae bacterium]|nr:AEC family transporter [Kiritimatiellia bacterium]